MAKAKKAYMNPEIKKKWIEALRSGDYDQTQERLKDAEGGFCCLGVLCDVYGKSKKKAAFDESGTFLLGGKEHLQWGDHTLLPEKVMKWAGFDSVIVTTNEDRASEYGVALPKGDSLHFLNDDGYTFGEIADRIEQEL